MGERNMGRKYTAGEIFNFEWYEQEVMEFIDLWHDGIRDIVELAETFERHQCEVAILIMDLAQRGFIDNKGKTKRKYIFAGDNTHELWAEEWHEKKPKGRPTKEGVNGEQSRKETTRNNPRKVRK